MKMKRLLMIGLCLLSVMQVFAQNPVNMNFNYDDNGNRTCNEIVITRILDKVNIQETESPFLTSALDSMNTVEISIYPNPTNDKVIVATRGMDSGQTLKAVLLSPTGKVLEERIVTDTGESFDLTGKASGVYLIEIYINQEKQIWKVIKR